MSKFLHTAPCPKCREKHKDRRGDNLGVYEDGSYCFSCGYTDKINFKPVFKPPVELKQEKVYLPTDCTYEIHPEALQWLSQYDISYKEIQENGLMWSFGHSRLIFPYWDQERCSWPRQLLGWQGRFIPVVEGRIHRKWYSQGSMKDIIVVKGNNQKHGIILVEDIVSAIKVGRQFTCMPLFGSHVNPNRLTGLGAKVTLWLDKDKEMESKQAMVSLVRFGFDVRVVSTDKDPKSLSDEEIKNILNNTELFNSSVV